jgi:hypothetical protein
MLGRCSDWLAHPAVASAAEDQTVPARDLYHQTVKTALLKDGWTITHDPLTLSFGRREVYADLGAERLLAAERGPEKIAVEVKSFRGASDLRDLELALGQYVLYRSLLARLDPGRKLFLAVPKIVVSTTLTDLISQPVLEDLGVAWLAFDPNEETIVQWKS